MQETVLVSSVKGWVAQLKVDVGMLNTVKNYLADVSRVGPSSEQLRAYG